MAQRYLKPEDCNNIDPNEKIRSFNCSASPNGGMECEGVGTGGQFKDCQTCLDQCPRFPPHHDGKGTVDPPHHDGKGTVDPPIKSTKRPIGAYGGRSNKLSAKTKVGIGVGAVVGVIGVIGLIIFMIRRKR
jgi:hypothetical protein